jgi:hypothetical protein
LSFEKSNQSADLVPEGGRQHSSPREIASGLLALRSLRTRAR